MSPLWIMVTQVPETSLAPSHSGHYQEAGVWNRARTWTQGLQSGMQTSTLASLADKCQFKPFIVFSANWTHQYTQLCSLLDLFLSIQKRASPFHIWGADCCWTVTHTVLYESHYKFKVSNPKKSNLSLFLWMRLHCGVKSKFIDW